MDTARHTVEVTGTSSDSWERAALEALVIAADTLQGPLVSEVVKHEVIVDERGATQFCTTLSVREEIDLRGLGDKGEPIKQYLIVANQTLASSGLEQLVHELVAASPCRFHVVVPQASTSTLHVDPSGLIDPSLHSAASDAYVIARQEAQNRLHTFRQLFDETSEAVLTGEVVVGDPLQAVRRVMNRSHFDEIIVSTLPAGASKWLKMDLPHRIERAFTIPVTSLIQSLEPA